MLDLILLQALIASTYTASKLVAYYAEPVTIVAVRMSLAGIILLTAYAVAYRHKRYPLSGQELSLMIMFGFFSMFIGYAVDFWGLRYVSSIKMALLYNLTPFFVALFSYIHFKERVTVIKFLGMITAFTSLLPVLVKTEPQEQLMTAFFFISTPELAIIFSSLSYAWGLMYMRTLLRKHNTPALLVNGCGMLFGGIFSCMAIPFIDHIPLVSNWMQFAMLSGYIIIVANVIYFMAYARLMKRYTVTLLSFGSFVATLFTILYGNLFLGEAITWHTGVAVVGVCAGLCMFYFQELKQGYIG